MTDIAIGATSALVITGQHTGVSNFIVYLVAPGGSTQLVHNAIGTFSGQVVLPRVAAGSYRVQVQADGVWTLAFAQPVPTPNDADLVATFSGTGSKVIPVLMSEPAQLVVSGQHQGFSNFIVFLHGYGNTTGEKLLFNQIGGFTGQTLVASLAAGGYLLDVQADGPWTLTFSR